MTTTDITTTQQIEELEKALAELKNIEKRSESTRRGGDTSDEDSGQSKKSPEYQIEKSIQYVKSSYDVIVGEDGRLYWGEKGTHVMRSGDDELKERIGLFALDGMSLTLKTVRDDALAYIRHEARREIEEGMKQPYTFTPRVMTSKDGSVWIDTGRGHHHSTVTTDKALGFIKVSPDGSWTMNAKPNEDVFFYRNSFIGQLDVEKDDITGITKLFEHINVPRDMIGNIVAFIVNGVVVPDGDQPVLYIQGQQGSGKTTTGERIKQIFFPTVGLGQEEAKAGLPESISDMNALLRQDACPFYDNITGLAVQMSDAICRIATGAAFASRKLYTDGDLAQSKYRRPQIITSVDQITMRADLQTRCVFIDPPKLQNEGKYQLGSVMRRKWYEDLPKIRGAFLTLAAEVLKRRAEKMHEGYTATTRMADFELTSVICDEILKESGILEDGYDSVQARADASSSLRTAAIPAVLDFLINHDDIEDIEDMKAAEILNLLRTEAKSVGHPTDYFPKSARGLSPILNDNWDVIEDNFDAEKRVDTRSRQLFYTLHRKNANSHNETRI